MLYLFIYFISKEWRCNEDQRSVGHFKIEQVFRYNYSYSDFSEG